MKGITVGDILLLVLLVVGVGMSFLHAGFTGSEGSLVLVEVSGLPVYKGNLDEPRKVTVKGGFGDVRIVIADKQVAVLSAECPNKVCVRTGSRSHAGDVIVCVPNRVIIRILGKLTPGVRGVTG